MLKTEEWEVLKRFKDIYLKRNERGRCYEYQCGGEDR